MDNKIHIISFSIPLPANYGGVIDVFYKIKSLHKAGVKITLHCFQYDREPAPELEQYCEAVYYYPRKMIGAHLLGFHPFIVSSRKSEELILNLLKDEALILYEGLHSCYSINDARLEGRKKIVRSHNIEHDYYAGLAKVEKKPMKRLYFLSEAKKLKRFEALALKKADVVLGISKKDTEYLNNQYRNAINVSAFHHFEQINIPSETKAFALYHGNLSVGENNEAAIYLADQVFRDLDYKLMIAGNQPSAELKNLVKTLPNVELKDDLSADQINDLIHTAHINVLPTFQSTGIKLKLLAALFNGGYCLVNSTMVKGTGLDGLVEIANSPLEFKDKLKTLAKTINSDELIKERNDKLAPFFNSENTKKLLEVLS